jgi:hypothetical protein
VIPRYESIPVGVRLEEGMLSLEREDGSRIADDLVAKFPLEGLPETLKVSGRLVGYRGKERCRVEDVETFLEDESGPVSRLVVYLLPGEGVDATMTGDNHRPFDVRIIPHRVVSPEGLDRRAREIATRLGVEVRAVDMPMGEQGFRYMPSEAVIENKQENALCWTSGSDRAVLRLKVDGSEVRFAIDRFNAVLLLKGRRFVAELERESAEDGDGDSKPIFEVPVERVTVRRAGLRVRLGGDLRGDYAISPIIARGTSKYLFYRSKREGR